MFPETDSAKMMKDVPWFLMKHKTQSASCGQGMTTASTHAVHTQKLAPWEDWDKTTPELSCRALK